MRRVAARLLPALFSFPEQAARQEGWGRLLELAATGGRLLTRTRLTKGERLFVSFELPGERFASLPARVWRARVDADGYFEARLEFLDEVEKRRLFRTLSRLAAS